MKRKIVIKLHVKCDGCRSKAMNIAAKTCGVSKIEIQGKGNDELVVIGDEIDAVKLTRKLRKKFHCVDVLKVDEEKEEKKQEKKEEEKPKCVVVGPCYHYGYPMHPLVVIDDPSPGFCPML